MRLAAAALTILLLWACPALADSVTATVTAPTSTLSSSVAWLSSTSTDPASQSSPASSTPPGDLPYTGDDLWPESVLAGLLVAGGVLLRLRWRRHP